MTSIIPIPTLVLVLWQNKLAAWTAMPGEALLDQPIEGERDWFNCPKPGLLNQAILDLIERIDNGAGKGTSLELLYDEASQYLLEQTMPQLPRHLGATHWQIQRWEKLSARCGRASTGNEPLARDWIAQCVLPVLLAEDNDVERQRLHDSTQREHAGLTEQLQAERQRLQRDNDVLRAQNTALRRVDADRLIVFLPALFPRVFSVLGGHDLALLTGRPEPYAIPNPYPEPSQETLHVLQRDFRALPHELQREIAAFIARLPQRQQLQPRPEMRELLVKLEKE